MTDKGKPWAEKFSDKPFTSGGIKIYPGWKFSETYKKFIKRHDRRLARGKSDAYRCHEYRKWLAERDRKKAVTALPILDETIIIEEDLLAIPDFLKRSAA
jgi:hypothetical protein